MKCSHDGCDSKKDPKGGFGLCRLHYGRKSRGADLDAKRQWRKQPGEQCKAPDCRRDPVSDGLCGGHWQQKRKGDREFRPLLVRGRYTGCRMPNCDGAHRAHGLCDSHYEILHIHKMQPERYEELLAEQLGVCAICMQKCTSRRRLAVDHCHETGRVRGLLCHRCNRGIGFLGDSRQLLLRASDYLKSRFDRRTV